MSKISNETIRSFQGTLFFHIGWEEFKKGRNSNSSLTAENNTLRENLNNLPMVTKFGLERVEKSISCPGLFFASLTTQLCLTCLED